MDEFRPRPWHVVVIFQYALPEKDGLQRKPLETGELETVLDGAAYSRSRAVIFRRLPDRKAERRTEFLS
jgi:hypothetical protein